MALVERLMHDPSEPEARHISVHQFFAAQQELATGHRTVAQVKAYYAMTAADEVDYDAMIALLPGTANTTQQINRINYIQRVHSVFILAEGRVTGYDTPAAVRAMLGI